MDWVKNLIGKGKKEELEADHYPSASSSSEESSEAPSENGAAASDAVATEGDAWPPRVTFEAMMADPSSPTAAAEPSSGAGRAMDGMAYLTQPDSMLDDSSHDEDENNDGDDGDNNFTAEGRREEIQDARAPPPSQRDRPNGKRRPSASGRARRQSGDFLAKLEGSPEGRRHSSTTSKGNGSQDVSAGISSVTQQQNMSVGKPFPTQPLSSEGAAVGGSSQPNPPSFSLRSPSPIMSRTMKQSPTMDSAKEWGDNNNAASYFEASPNPKAALGVSVKEEKSTPSKDAMDVDKSATNNDCDQHQENVDFGTADTPAGKQPQQLEPPSLSQSIMGSPLRSPSPLMMSQIAKLSPPVDSTTGGGDGSNAGTVVKEESSATPRRALDMEGVKDENEDVENEKSTPSKDAMDDVDGSATNDDHGRHEEHFDFAAAEPRMHDEITEEWQKNRRIIHQMNMKKQAIYRSLLHLSDNSYSFVYDDPKNGQTSNAMNDDGDEPGLPFIGPGVKDQYEMLRSLLRKGLLGHTDDDLEEESKNDQNGEGGQRQPNPFLPKIQSNVSAVLMGPRGHGKTLVLERCLASLSRLAAERKERVLTRLMEGERRPDHAEEMYAQASFRVVRLNGLMFQGDSAVACTREIARQIGVMSREERRRTRRIMKEVRIARRRRRRRSQALTSSGLETPKSSKRRRKEERSPANKSGGTEPSTTSPTTPSAPDTSATPDNPTPGSAHNDESHDLRVRRSGFNTYIALLDEVLRTARVDGIPILIVLEELDTFLTGGRSTTTGATEDGTQPDGVGGDRQLLLYHLLDRVADHKFLVSLVGMTTDLTAVTKLEKRVQSRAEGTSKVVYFGHDGDYDGLAKSLLGKFYTPPRAAEEDVDEDYDERKAMLDVRDEVEVILRGGRSGDKLLSQEEKDGEINDYAIVQRVLQRNYELIGSDMRWVCRVFDVALGLLASDIDERIHECMENAGDNREGSRDIIVPKLSPRHMARALVTMSASLDDVSGTVGRPGIPTQSAMELVRWGQLLDDPGHYSCLLGTHPRLAALLDLSGPQVAVLLAARRITARDDTRATAEDEVEDIRRRESAGGGGGTTATAAVAPLTYRRIRDEYASSFVASGRYTIGSDRYPPHVLRRSFADLMELDLLRPRREQCRGGALQYGHNDALSAGTDASNLPLHANLDWDLEFMGPLKAGLLQCSTALREWGMNMN